MDNPECVWNAHAELGEGPLWSVSSQALYWVDILNHRLHRYAPRQEQRTWQFDQEITSVAERADGSGLVVTLRHGFAAFDPDTEKLTHLKLVEGHLPANRFNDGKCDKLGRYWAGTMDFDGKRGTGALYRLSHDLSCTPMDTDYVVTNGPAWSSDYTAMYHNDSVNGRVYRFDYKLDTGEISNKRLFLQFAKEDGSPDGMTTDADGGLWIAHWGAAKVTRHDPDGKVLRTIDLPCSQVTSCTFGGPDLTTLYITTAAVGLSPEQRANEPLAGGLFAADLSGLGIAGVPANPFRG